MIKLMLHKYDNLPVSRIFLWTRYSLNMSRMYNPFLPMDNFLMENLPVFAYFSTMVSSRAMVSMYRSPPILISFSTFTENIVSNIEWRHDNVYLINKVYLQRTQLCFVAIPPTPNWWKLRFNVKKTLEHIAIDIHEVDKMGLFLCRELYKLQKISVEK